MTSWWPQACLDMSTQYAKENPMRHCSFKPFNIQLPICLQLESANKDIAKELTL